MSRLEFRAQVSEPRPTSAWLMVGVAGATLWITQQLAPWAVGIEALAIVLSLARRHHPHRWQRSPVALNLGMAAITLVTIQLALGGASTTIALAHFVALTQGLKLLDARPRKSEFLLVALALIHVILAANLTASVFFPPLLVIFVFATTWTLLVHTLRTEALEAHEGGAAGRAIDPQLLRTTLVASGLCVVLAMVLFVVLPRLRSGMLHGPSAGSALSSSGFSDRVELGDLGRIRHDPTVVLRVETLEGDPPERRDAYWRGLAFDTFDGRHWSIGPGARRRLPGAPELGLDLVHPPAPALLVQRIVREPVEAGVLFSAGRGQRIAGTLREVERDANGGLYATSQVHERVRYTVWSDAPHWADVQLAGDRALPPPHTGHRYLALPELDPRIEVLALRVAGAAASDAARARALEDHLREAGRYTDEPPPLGNEAGQSPIEAFLLGDVSGHCEYFASAMVVLARTLGLPARLVNGFAGGRTNPIGGFVELARSDAHAWVEVHFEQSGWVRYDPTPPDLRLRAQVGLSVAERLAQIGSAAELWWYQRVVGFDRSDQLRAARSAWMAWHDWRGARRRTDTRAAGREPAAWGVLERLPRRETLLVAAGLGLLLELLRRRRAREVPSRALPRAYAGALRLLARHGLRRGASTTARDFAREVTAATPAGAGIAFAELTESYLAERFGSQARPVAPVQLARLRDALRRR